MAVTELLVLVTLLSHLAGCAHAFCWKPNLNPFMGTSHLKTLDNNIWFQHWIKSQRCPGYGTGRLVNCAGQLGRRLPKGRCLWRGFPLRKSSWWFLSRENYHDNHFPCCDQVDFLIKSHPLDAPSNYKLSDLTLKVLSSSFSQKKKKNYLRWM